MAGQSVPTVIKVAATLMTIAFSSMAAVIFIRALAVELPPQSSSGSQQVYKDIPMTPETLDRFSRVLKIGTVSYDKHDQNNQNRNSNERTNKTDMHNLLNLKISLEKSFPVIHNSSLVVLEIINNFSLLYTVKGSDEKLKPYMLAAHLDVVPANADRWEHPPFSGDVDNDFIYGRGTMDDKQNVMGILEAVEYFLKSGFQPQRTIYLAFGHDEEILGKYGAQEIARLLHSRKVQLQFVLDEGFFIANNTIKFIKQPVAMIGVAEKGYLTLRLSVKSKPGHSSIPPTNTVIGILAKAVTRLEENPHRNMFGTGVEVSMLEHLASYSPFHMKLVFANLWIFSPIVSWVMARDKLQSSFIRTTTIVTMFNGGVKSNVIPEEAVAFVNHRIHQSQSTNEILKRDEEIIDDKRVKIEVVQASEPSPVSPFAKNTFGFQLLKYTILQLYSNVAIAPASLVATTDCRYYTELTDEIYRFSPIILEPDDFSRFHGNNERISIENYKKTINFFHRLILNADMEMGTENLFRRIDL